MNTPSNTPNVRRRRRTAGFTLLEVLIAIALIAAIAVVLITNLDKILGSGNKEVARIFVTESLETPLMTYRVHTGSYPTTEQGLQALLTQPADVSNWQGPYVKKIPEDPWGNPYNYQYPAQRSSGAYDLWSWGPDGEESEDDITNREGSAAEGDGGGSDNDAGGATGAPALP